MTAAGCGSSNISNTQTPLVSTASKWTVTHAQFTIKFPNRHRTAPRAPTACAINYSAEGTSVGPELTHANRQDRDFLLISIVDPSAVIRKEFLNYNVELKDGSVLSGLIAEQNANSITLVVAKNQRTAINRSQIISLRESAVSLMPEGLLNALKPQELRDLFSYLQK
jgi:putative heme-binding domain-containing protein